MDRDRMNESAQYEWSLVRAWLVCYAWKMHSIFYSKTNKFDLTVRIVRRKLINKLNLACKTSVQKHCSAGVIESYMF